MRSVVLTTEPASPRQMRPAPHAAAGMVAGRPLRVLQVGTVEAGGGAAAIANALHQAYRDRGVRSWQAVGHKLSADPDVFALPDDDRLAFRATGYTAVQAGLRRLAGRFPGRGWGLINRSLRRLTHPGVWSLERRGVEDFDFPGTRSLLDLGPAAPDLVHCHNLHGGYFDLRALAWLSHRVPTALTLHDAWLLAGHCAHSLGCARWKTGCGTCPDLRLHPAVRRDATAENWLRKREIYARSRLYAAAPSRWLVDRAAQSMLAPALADLRVIPHGVNLSVFQPADRRAVRARLGLPPDARTLLLTAGSHHSVWKDRRTLHAAMATIADRVSTRNVIFVALEDAGAHAAAGPLDVRFVGYQPDPAALAAYYQAADVYVHAARADTFPTAVLEALACGTPVLATNVGGIPEQVVPLGLDSLHAGGGAGDTTGVLVPAREAETLADAAVALLEHDVLRQAMGDNAARDARRRFDHTRQVADYLSWYQDILADWRARPAQDVP